MIEEKIRTYLVAARSGAEQLALLSSEQKNRLLRAMQLELASSYSAIAEANRRDLDAASNQGLSAAMLDRLTLDESRFSAMLSGIEQVMQLPDPVGKILSKSVRENGLELSKVSTPIGVIAIIYEARPNVTADAAALCIKAGNAVVLRGGREALNTNIAIATAMRQAIEQLNISPAILQMIDIADRAVVQVLVGMEGLLDLVIPRGGETLIRAVTEHARVPVIKHYKGVCHVYVDGSASTSMAMNIVENAKCQRPGVCNALETLLVHESIAADFLPTLNKQLRAKGVELRGCEQTCRIIDAIPASDADWTTEYLALILSIKVVPSLEAAISHINTYGSHHSDAIVTEDSSAAEHFLQAVDSAAVYHNVSTRFTDGGEFGLGAEIGISTDKLHARGPMGLEELTTYKFMVRGTGQVRE